jgi:hypothetical protein
LSKKHRIAMAAVAVILVVVTEGYVHFVVRTYSQYSTTEGWIRNDLAWYVRHLRHAAHATVSVLAFCALAICGLAFVLRIRGERPAGSPSTIGSDRPTATWLKLPTRLDPVMVLCIGVPVIILGGAVASSILLSPNFTDRNMLVCAPFLWGAMARLYDLGVTPSAKPIRRPANLALSVIVLLTAGIAFNRGLPHNEPFRETSNWIRAVPACRGQEIPVLIFDRKIWANPAFTERLHVDAYDRYLGDFARPRIIFMEDLAAGRLPAALRSELQRRVDGQGCPVLAWSARDLGEPGPVISRNLLASIGRPQAAGSLREQTFRVYKVGLIRRLAPPQGRILYLDRQDVR